MPTKPSPRQRIPPNIEKHVLAKSRRRCALCFQLGRDTQEKDGQIAHLDHNPSNNAEGNLVFLCLLHHSRYDSTTSQHKNYTMAEVKHARDELYRWVKRGMPSLTDQAPAALELGDSRAYGRVVLYCREGGTDLQVETFGTEAINVRLVPVESEQFRLRSEVIRCLKPDVPQPFVLRCERRQDKSSPAAQKFAEPTQFFNDLCDSLLPNKGSTRTEMLEQALTLLNEQQLAVTLELAYSDPSGSNHYRRQFKVRWDRFNEAITDVEPIHLGRDDNPPPTTPFNVILP